MTVATAKHIRLLAARLSVKNQQGLPLAVHWQGEWNGSTVIDLGTLNLRVRQGNGPLALREALTEPSQEPLLILTDQQESEIAEDICVRLYRGKLHRVRDWELIKDLFSAQTIDPRLIKDNWIAETLLHLAPANSNYPPVAGTSLSQDMARSTLLMQALSLKDLQFRTMLLWISEILIVPSIPLSYTGADSARSWSKSCFPS